MQVRNIFSEIPETLPDELFEEIIRGRSFKLERIVSRGHATPPNEWYDQDRPEWVVLLTGGATLRFEQQDEMLELTCGDAVIIPAHCRHRVESTVEGKDTVWLALHYDE